MRIAIYDSSAADRDRQTLLIRSELSGRSVSFSMRYYTTKKELLYDVEDGDGFDIVFLDILTENKGGLEVARQLRSLRFDGDIIFTCGCTDFAVEGYEVGASGYLLKPHNAVAVQRLMERLINRLNKACLTVRRRNAVARIPYHEILYIESCNSKCLVHRADAREYVVYRHLDDLEEQLHDGRFLRCHQSYLVNMDHIAKAGKQFEMISGDTVCIRQRDLKRIRDHYLSYIASLEKI